MKHLVIFVVLIGLIGFNQSFAEEIIPITQSSPISNVQFDGKWTDELEWKPSSLYELNTENGKIYLRSAHHQNYIYIMIDAVPDTDPVPQDFAVVCFDTNNDKTSTPMPDDYCFFSGLTQDSSIVKQGNGTGFIYVSTPLDFISIGNTSDHNDRYSKTPHSSYEFKIPTELVGRNDKYGFFFMVNDYENAQYFWSNATINSPDSWGILISPDKSLPEFNFVLLILGIGFPIVIIVSKISKPFNIF